MKIETKTWFVFLRPEESVTTHKEKYGLCEILKQNTINQIAMLCRWHLNSMHLVISLYGKTNIFIGGKCFILVWQKHLCINRGDLRRATQKFAPRGKKPLQITGQNESFGTKNLLFHYKGGLIARRHLQAHLCQTPPIHSPKHILPWIQFQLPDPPPLPPFLVTLLITTEIK